VGGFDPEALIREAQAIRASAGRARSQGVATLVEPPPAEMTAPKLPRADRADRGIQQAGIGQRTGVALTKAGGFRQGAEEASQEGYAEASEMSQAGARRRTPRASPTIPFIFRGIKLNLFSKLIVSMEGCRSPA